MNVILIEKDGAIFEKNVKTIEKLYSLCGYRTNKEFEKLYEWEFDKNIYELYGKKSGKKDKENNYVFPKYDKIDSQYMEIDTKTDKEKYYGTLCVVKQNSSITLDEWNIFYMSFTTEKNCSSMSDSESRYSEVDDDRELELDTKFVKQKHDEELTYEEYEAE